MARFCTQCGAQVDETAKFCRKCGAKLTPTQPAEHSAPTVSAQTTTYQGGPDFSPVQPHYHQQPYQEPYQAPAPQADLKPNVAGMLCYPLLFITGILFLVLTPYNKDRFIRFHAWQSILIAIGLAILNIAMGLLPWPLSIISGFYFSVMPLLVMGGIAWLMYKAYQYEWFKLPIIGDWAESQASKNTP